MSSRIRGSEATISVMVADAFAAAFGIVGRMEGSFFHVKDWTATPRTDLVEESYLGENFDHLDIQHHGWDFSFSIDEKDAAAINFMDLVTYKEEFNLAPPEVSVSVTYKYRDVTTLSRTELFIQCVMKLSERSIGGRKEYISNSFEGKARQKRTAIGI